MGIVLENCHRRRRKVEKSRRTNDVDDDEMTSNYIKNNSTTIHRINFDDNCCGCCSSKINRFDDRKFDRRRNSSLRNSKKVITTYDTTMTTKMRKRRARNFCNSTTTTIFVYLFFLLTFLEFGGRISTAAPLINKTATESTLDVLRDQSGTSPLEINERARRCSNTTQLFCTSDELETASVCGSDGRTYSSICEIKKMACHGNPVQVIDKNGPCPAKKKCLLESAFQKDLARRRNDSDIVIPECEADGSYSSVQCHKGTGFCWCVTNFGRPIPTTSVQFKRPDCLPQGKVGRRSSRRRLGTRRRGCGTAERSTFSTNLMKIFRADYEKDTRNRQSITNREGTTTGVVASKTRQVIEWKFDKLDTNRDRGISPRESADLRRMIRDRVQPKACARRFAKYCDLDGDKRITRSEWSLCLGVDINMSFNFFKSLNTSDENAPRSDLSNQPNNDQIGGSGTEEDEHEDESDHDHRIEEITTMRPDNINQRSTRNRQRNPEEINGERRRGPNVGVQRQPYLRSQSNQQTQRRHANSAGGLHSENPLIEGSRDMISSAPVSGLAFLSDKTQKPEKDEIEEATDCQSVRRRALDDHQKNPSSGFYIPKCQTSPESDGRVGRLYERVQCHDVAGFCWCADPETGKPIPGTPKKLEKPDCSPTTSPNSGKLANQNGADGEIKGCTPKKRADFLRRLHGTLVSSMIASGHADTEDMSQVERALRWKFDELDKNKNKILERKEWKPYRLELKTWKGMRKCGRNFLRSCDANGDKRITLAEWLNCAGNSLRAATSTARPNNRRGPNPFVKILDPHQ